MPNNTAIITLCSALLFIVFLKVCWIHLISSRPELTLIVDLDTASSLLHTTALNSRTVVCQVHSSLAEEACCHWSTDSLHPWPAQKVWPNSSSLTTRSRHRRSCILPRDSSHWKRLPQKPLVFLISNRQNRRCLLYDRSSRTCAKAKALRSSVQQFSIDAELASCDSRQGGHDCWQNERRIIPKWSGWCFQMVDIYDCRCHFSPCIWRALRDAR